MTDTTARLALPFLAPGQAQKELAHNEALVRIDAALHPAATAMEAVNPPSAPAIGQCWVLGTAPTGDWAGQAHALAIWTEGGWRFVAPAVGMTVWLPADGLSARFDGANWVAGTVTAAQILIGGVQVVGARQPAIAEPDAGTVVDVQARATISAIIQSLASHGLIAS